MEVFAGYSENADWNVGRLLDAIEEMGDLDNTLIFYIWGGNGASMEGTVTGSFNEMTFLNGIVLDAGQQLALIEQYGGVEALGGEHTAPHYAAAWAHAGNTPFQWGRQMSSHLGGDRNPMVVAWPARIQAGRDLRAQFTHCIDVAPTVLEAIGLPEPTTVDGIGQEPMDGISFLSTFADANADEAHTVQYFEMLWVDGSGLLHHTYSLLGVETYKQVSTEAIPTGAVSVKMLFAADEAKPETGGTVTLWANGTVIGEGKMPHTVPIAFSSYAGMDIGRDNGLVVDLDYEDKAPYAFTGTVKKVVFDLKPATHEDEKALHEHAQMHGIGRGAAG